MWSRLKALPIFAKIIIAVLVLAGIYQMGRFQNRSHSHTESFSPGAGFNDADNEAPSTASGGASQALAQFQSQQAQLMTRVRQCQSEMTEATNEMARAAVQGGMVNNRPPCEQYMPQWIAQEAYFETEIYRIQSGDHTSSLRQITGIAAPVADSGSSRGTSRSDDGTEAVENWDREAIRGNSLYTDESGQQHELPTRSYYFRDRSSGQMIGSDQPNPPNDGRDYEQLTYQPH